jgi:hypothetical protein
VEDLELNSRRELDSLDGSDIDKARAPRTVDVPRCDEGELTRVRGPSVSALRHNAEEHRSQPLDAIVTAS